MHMGHRAGAAAHLLTHVDQLAAVGRTALQPPLHGELLAGVQVAVQTGAVDHDGFSRLKHGFFTKPGANVRAGRDTGLVRALDAAGHGSADVGMHAGSLHHALDQDIASHDLEPRAHVLAHHEVAYEQDIAGAQVDIAGNGEYRPHRDAPPPCTGHNR